MNKSLFFKYLTNKICSTYQMGLNLRSLFSGNIVFRIKSLLFGVEVGKGCKCYGKIHLIKAAKSKITLGNKVIIVSDTLRSSSSSIYAPTKLRTFLDTACIIIEDNVSLNGTSITARSKKIRIGQGTCIAPNVVILDSDFHALWPPDNRADSPGIENDADVNIGKNVWIAMQCLILKGVSIGDNSVIAAGSVVTSDIPLNVLAGGVPAKIIRKLP